jgi:hypothetical protein
LYLSQLSFLTSVTRLSKHKSGSVVEVDIYTTPTGLLEFFPPRRTQGKRA